MLRFYTYTLFFLIGFVGIVINATAQSSLYQDAALIADFLKASQPPQLVFELKGGAKPTIASFSEKRKTLERPLYRLPELSEYYTIGASSPNINHVLKIVLPDTSLTITPFDSIGIWYDINGLDIYHLNNDSLVISIPSWRKDQRFANIEYILGFHTDFDRLAKPGYRFSMARSIEDYQDNPFVPAAWRRSPFLDPRWAITEARSNSFAESYYQQYPWQRLLTGDSILQLKQAISFQEVSSSYRQPIITSQRALDVSSSRINQTSRNRGLLDAQTVATGLSDFIAERAQEELNLTFFNRFKENLNKPSELTMLFPSTRDLLYKFEISNYKTLLAHARGVFELDLENLGVNFPKILTLPKYKSLNNDPNVFNLSLIYSIADLAYKEYPVETILLSAHQMLQERQINLQQSIHQQLADTLIVMSQLKFQANKEARKMEENRILVGGDYIFIQDLQDSVRNKMLAYLDEVERVSWALESFATEEVYPEQQNELIDLSIAYDRATPSTTTSTRKLYFDGKSELGLIEKSIDDSYRYLELVGYNTGKNIEYQNRTLDEYYTRFDHYRNVIPVHLSGQEYYGYILEQPRKGDHDQYFLAEPLPQNELLAQGLDETQIILHRDYAPKMLAFQQLLKGHLNTLRKYKTERLGLQNANNERLRQAIAFDQRFQLLASAIDREIAFWTTASEQNESNHYIAGLYFLRSYLHNNQQSTSAKEEDSENDKKGQQNTDNLSVWRVRQLAHHLSASPEAYDDIIALAQFKPLLENYSIAMQQAEDRIDYIEQGLTKQVNLLVKKFGERRIPASAFQNCLVTADYEEQSQLLQERTFFLYCQQDAIRERLFDEAHYESLNIAIAEDSSFIEIQQQIDSLSYLLGNEDFYSNLTTPEQDSISKRYEGLWAEKEQVVSNLQTDKEQVYQNWYTTMQMDEKLAALSDSINLIDSLYYNYDYTSTPDSLVKISDCYQFTDNSSYQAYHIKHINADLYANPILEHLNILDDQLYDLGKLVKEVQKKEDQLEQLLDTLETTYSPSLVRAKNNADNLAKSIELSAHLLFSFRNYKRTHDTLFYQDSVYIEVTTSRLDTITRLVDTYRSDSLKVIRRPVPGTTKPVSEARWITREEFDALRTDEMRWSVFLALLYQRLRSIDDAPNFSPDGVALLATKFLQIANDVEINLNSLRRKKAETPDDVVFKDYYPFIRSTVDLFNTVLDSKCISKESDPNVLISFVEQGASFQPLGLIPRISNEALSLYENIYVKDYGNAILNAMELLKLITSTELDKKARSQSGRAINAVLTYGTFMANMLSAESSDQVKTILQAATLPPGSSRIKREVSSNITINSYLGGALGRDQLLDAPVDLKSASFGAALSVPIGITYSFSPNFIKNNSSFSLHVPLLDLGAITAYRQSPQNSIYSVKQLPEFNWENLFSPGLFAVYNFANSPFSLGVGGQYGPQLREIQVDNGEPLFLNSWRFPMVTFSIDVPFFNLHTGPRKIIVK